MPGVVAALITARHDRVYAMTGRPTIGLTLDSEGPGGYSEQPWYAIRENNCAAVVRAGGLPVLLPHEPGRPVALVAACAASGLRRLEA